MQQQMRLTLNQIYMRISVILQQLAKRAGEQRTCATRPKKTKPAATVKPVQLLHHLFKQQYRGYSFNCTTKRATSAVASTARCRFARSGVLEYRHTCTWISTSFKLEDIYVASSWGPTRPTAVLHIEALHHVRFSSTPVRRKRNASQCLIVGSCV